MEQRRRRTRTRNRRKWFIYSLIGAMTLLLISAGSIFLYSYVQGPPSLTSQQNTVLYSADQEVIGVKHGNQNRYWVPLEEINPHLKQAFLTTEDQDFYNHFGFDLTRILTAITKNIIHMDKVEGASTITQQYARNLFLTHEKSWDRKIKEAFYALRLEMFYDKDKILEGYLNTIYFGHGNYGVEAASRYYFDKHAKELTIAEASMLAGIPKGPSYYSPIDHPENAKKRQRTILHLMAENKDISKAELNKALKEKLAFSEEDERKGKQIAPYFQDVVMNEASELLDVTNKELKTGGYKIYTTLKQDMQKKLKETSNKKIDDSSNIQVAALSIAPKTGAIQALLGGRNYQESPYNRALQAKRMAGSTFKPFLYYAALNRGATPATPLESEPTEFKLANGKVYAPSNYNGYYANDEITLAQALALSDNIYAVKTNLYYKPETLVETAKQFGIKSVLPAVPSLALGTASVSVLEMARGYGMLANGGQALHPHTIQKITDSSGEVLYERGKPSKKQILDPDTSFVLTHLMTGMFDTSLNDYSRVTGAGITDQLTREYAGKTGSTDTDNWMIGFSPQVVTAVWTGYDQNKEITKAKELTYARHIWADYMEAVHQDLPERKFKPPEGVTAVAMDPHTGKLAHSGCEDQRVTYFIKGTEPQSYCTLHVPNPEKSEEDKQRKKDGKSIWDWIGF
ncbi:penicillin-binding protein, 1A family [Salinibacillus kushneri]|uniref:Penicillin-binding protein, 1A family n=1 Tax=Salinibacillus kushneri TaxID=237682 RepID=A0A1I0CSV9_9BACI|nr:PBP1A family penicillin-binding protein [Salinibacillus kushneri]SET22882.1 penicillin-binding protein, 1A family [Salinibacillus kushneri]